jgi:hypothetical protein
MSRSAIQKHADKYLGHLGKVELRNGHREAHGIYGATVVLTRVDCVEYYAAFAGGGAVSMTRTRTEPVPELPIFAVRANSRTDLF